MAVNDDRKNQRVALVPRAGPRDVVLKRDHWLVGYPQGKGLAIVFGDDDENARRFVACWNACINISTDGVERVARCGGFAASEDRGDG